MYLKKSIHFAASCQTFFQISFHSFCFIIYHSIITNKSFIQYFYHSLHLQTANSNNQQQQPKLEQFHSIYNEGFIVPLFSFSIKLINSRSMFHSHSFTSTFTRNSLYVAFQYPIDSELKYLSLHSPAYSYTHYYADRVERDRYHFHCIDFFQK